MRSNSIGKQVRQSLSTAGPLVAVILLSVILSIATPAFFTMENTMNILRQTAVNSIIAVGMLLVLITAGIDLSVGSMCALSSCVMGVLLRDFGIENSFVLIIACILTGTMCGLLNGLIYTRLRLPHPFIATLGTMQIFRGIAQIITDSTPITGFPNAVTTLGFLNIGKLPLCFLVVVVVFFIFGFILNSTPIGKKIYSVGGNEEAALVSGINVKNVKLLVYVISGLMSGLAALILTGRVSTALPTTGENYAMDAIASCVIGGTSFNGGKGTVSGTFVGALLVQVIRNGLNLLGAQQDLQNVVIGSVVILAVVIDVFRELSGEKAARIAQSKAKNN
ncbi:ABC transporter permease [Ruminococcaceae bacterium OttesenSCG-928-I18]|nr:ABC transporter permease [Ruminococcaceae bacterium OttesenSCG-928-I18]